MLCRECEARTPDGDSNGMTHLESGLSGMYFDRPLYIRFKETLSIWLANRWWLARALRGVDFFGRVSEFGATGSRQ